MTDLTTTYRLIVLGRGGMYTYGDDACSPALARLVPGNLSLRPGERLVIQRRDYDGSTWTDANGDSHLRVVRSVIVEAESAPGEWGVMG